MTRRPPVEPLGHWPSVDDLEAMGLVPCEGSDRCSMFVDPANVPSRMCQRHQAEAAAKRREKARERRFHHQARIRDGERQGNQSA